MNLFGTTAIDNLLPFDGTVSYQPDFMTPGKAQQAFDTLLAETEWRNDEAYIFGKHIITSRKVAWYGDGDYEYAYSNVARKALPFTAALQAMRQQVETACGQNFNSCLLNLYHQGNEGMAWHSDDEKCMGHRPFIASLSLGAARRFSFKHKRTGQRVDLLLEPGSLLLMQNDTQTNWLHCLPKTTRVLQPRINLTFRKFIDQ